MWLGNLCFAPLRNPPIPRALGKHLVSERGQRQGGRGLEHSDYCFPNWLLSTWTLCNYSSSVPSYFQSSPDELPEDALGVFIFQHSNCLVKPRQEKGLPSRTNSITCIYLSPCKKIRGGEGGWEGCRHSQEQDLLSHTYVEEGRFLRLCWGWCRSFWCKPACCLHWCSLHKSHRSLREKIYLTLPYPDSESPTLNSFFLDCCYSTIGSSTDRQYMWHRGLLPFLLSLLLA